MTRAFSPQYPFTTVTQPCGLGYYEAGRWPFNPMLFETKYYALRDCYIDKPNARAHTSFDVSGRYNDDFNMHLYVVFPLWPKSTDASASGKPCPAWLALEFKKTISNHLGDAAKQTFVNIFLKTNEEYINRHISGTFALNQITFLERPGHTDARDGFQAAIKTQNSN